MADVKISELPEVFNPYLTDVVPIVNEGETKKTTLATILSYSYDGSDVRSLTGDYTEISTFVRANSGSWEDKPLTSDIVVSLSAGKTFGKYVNGDTIPATGKTIEQVLRMATTETLEPLVTLTSNSTVGFNQINISNTLNFGYVIKTLNATVQSAVLEWRRNNTGSWNILSLNSSDITFTHILVDSNFNTQPFNYRYTVIDSAGGAKQVTKDITPSSYVQPTVSLTIVGDNITSPETDSLREKGNVSSTISGTITRQSANVALQSYQLQYRPNGDSWSNVGSSVSVTDGNTASITSVVHNPTSDAGANSLEYRVQVVDDYQTTTITNTSTVNFNYFIFYGPAASIPLNSANVRNLPSKAFTSVLSNPFNLISGTTNTIFAVALPTAVPSSDTITGVIDLDALNAPLTYTNNPFTVNDYAGTGSTYNVYTLSLGTPYSPSHRHQITRG